MRVMYNKETTKRRDFAARRGAPARSASPPSASRFSVEDEKKQSILDTQTIEVQREPPKLTEGPGRSASFDPSERIDLPEREEEKTPYEVVRGAVRDHSKEPAPPSPEPPLDH